MMAWLSVALAVWLAQASPTSMRTLDKGLGSNVDAARQAVARTPAEWSALWKAHDLDRPAPSVDLSHEMVIGVFMGSRPTGGYSVEIVGIEERGGMRVVKYREGAPPEGALTAQILTSPYHIVAVPTFAGEVAFEKVKTKN